MKIFISWSGDTSKAVAGALRNWIPLLFQHVKPWMSEVDIKAGTRWGDEIDKELNDTNFGIICLTKTNIEAPWLLFETGAIAKSVVNAYVCTYLIDLEKVDIPSGPLTKFQAKKNDKEGTQDILNSINAALGDDGRSDDQLKTLFDKVWPDLEKIFSELPKENGEQELKRSNDDMIKEILEIVRNLSIKFPSFYTTSFSGGLDLDTEAASASGIPNKYSIALEQLKSKHKLTGIPIPDEVYAPDIKPKSHGLKKQSKQSENENDQSPTKGD